MNIETKKELMLIDKTIRILWDRSKGKTNSNSCKFGDKYYAKEMLKLLIKIKKSILKNIY